MKPMKTNKWPGLLPSIICCMFCCIIFFKSSAQTVFNDIPVTDGSVKTMAFDSNYVYIGGAFSAVYQNSGNAARLSTTSTVLSTCFPVVSKSTGGTSSINAIAPDGSGGWYIGGDFDRVDNTTRNNLAHIFSNGALDASWNPNSNGIVNSLVVDAGKVYLGGSFTTIAGSSRSRLARVSASNGSLDAWPAAFPSGSINCIIVSGTDVFIGGLFTSIGVSTRNYAAKFNATTGALDANWSLALSAQVNCMAMDGSFLYLGGNFTNLSGKSYLARVSPSGTGAVDSWNPAPSNRVECILITGNDLYIGGPFTSVSGGAVTRNAIAKFNLTDLSVSSWNQTLSITPYALATDGTDIFVAGIATYLSDYYCAVKFNATSGSLVTSWLNRFSPGTAGTTGNAISINGTDVLVGGNYKGGNRISRKNVARFSRGSMIPDQSWNPNPNGGIEDIEVSGNNVYIAGAFTTVGGQSRSYVAKVDNTNGSLDATWNPNPNATVSAIKVDGTSMYIGGNFTSIGATTRNRIARVNLSTGALDSWNPGADGAVLTIAVTSSQVYMGGGFATVGGTARNALAIVSKSTGSVSSVNAQADGIVNTILINGSTVYVGGTFTTFGGSSSCKYIARFSTSGTFDNTWTPNAAGGNTINTILVDGTDVYVGGSFSQLGGASRNNIGKLSTLSNTADATWNPNADNIVRELLKVGSDIYIGGAFTTMSSLPRNGLAHLSTSASVTKVWQGGTSSDWATSCNWLPVLVPISTDVVLIPKGTSNAPDLGSGNYTIQGITIDPGAVLLTNAGTLTVTGSVVNNGTVTAASSTSGQFIMGGSVAQQVNGTGTFDNLRINNSAGVSIASGNIGITGTLSITSGTLTTNGLLTIKSTLAGSGRVAQLSGTPISGNVTVERYIPAKSMRKWSFITCPVSGNTIRNGWQDDVFITGTGSGGTICGTGGTQYNSNGFDRTALSNASMFVYNASLVNGSRWVSVPNTTGTNLAPGTGYRMNIRGSRGVADANCVAQINTVNPATPVATTLSATGTLVQGSLGVTVFGRTSAGSSGNAYTLLGNPYASEVSLQSFYTGNSSAITSSFWFYSALSTYTIFSTYNAITQQSLDFPTGYSNGTVSDVIIANGQSFFVERSSATDGTVTFNESHKSTTATTGNGFYRTVGVINNKINIKLSSVSDSEATSSIFVNYVEDTLASATAVTLFDSYSFNTGNGLFLVSMKGDKNLSIQTKPGFNGNDTISLNFKADTGNYKLSFSEYDQFITATEIKLIDNFTGTITDVRQNPEYSFSVTSDNNSYGSSRFRVVFRSAILPISGIALNGTSRQEGVQLNWTVLTETDMNGYVVERSSDGRAFTAIGQVKATGNNNSNHNYTYLDTKPLSNTSYYRIRAIGNNGEIKYSSIIKIQQGKTWSVQLYPNPVKDQLYITMNNTGSDEVYTFRIINAYGQEVLRSNGKALSGKLSVNVSTLTQGIYQLQVFNKSGEVVTEKFIRR